MICKNITVLLFNFSFPQTLRDIKSQLENVLSANQNYRGIFALQYKEVFFSPLASLYFNHNNAAHAQVYDIEKEFERQGLTANKKWRLSKANSNYQLCSSYPNLLCVPAIISDHEICFASEFRAKERIPVLTYIYKNNHVICRASQPKTGIKLMNRRCFEDEMLVDAIKESSPNASSLIVFDARPKVNAIANQAKGAGYENVYNAYVNCEVKFLNIENMHAVRNSFNSLRELCSNYLNNLNFSDRP